MIISHYGALLNFVHMFSSIVHVLDIIKAEGSDGKQRRQANILLKNIKKFEFIFMLHLDEKYFDNDP